MKYISTRGEAPALEFEGALLAGLASDGGLYVPETWPQITVPEIANLTDKSYEEVAYRIMQPFINDAIPTDTLRTIIHDAYKDFRHAAIAPLKQLSHNEWLLELFHGPTLAFKDFALQVLGRLLDHALSKRQETITIVGATSGDTGSAAIAGCMGRDNMRVFILHPHGRVSDVQRRQMTTVEAGNVHNVAIKGTFDDCQNLVKALFGDQSFRKAQNLAAVNSINWARIMAQVVYYFTASIALGSPARAINFVVPTGNFGDIYAGYVAHNMGLPINKLIVATNCNDILARFFNHGDYSCRDVKATIAPSIDIQISSNFERLLFDLCDRDGATIRQKMQNFTNTGTLEIDDNVVQKAQKLFSAASLNTEAAIEATIKTIYRQTGELLDPHTAVGVGAGRTLELDGSNIYLATAHPAKFPDAVKKATGVHPPLPPHLADLFDREERYEILENDLETVKKYINKV